MSTRQAIQEALKPLREQQRVLQDELNQLMVKVEDKREELRQLDRFLRNDPDQIAQRPKRKNTRPAKSTNSGEQKRYPGLTISDEKTDAILASLRKIGRPASTREIAEGMTVELSQSTVGKALTDLSNANIVRRAGIMSGVRGKRPLYAPWPDGGISRVEAMSNGGDQ